VSIIEHNPDSERSANDAKSNCFVHQLLDGHRRGASAPIREIRESILSSMDKDPEGLSEQANHHHSRVLSKRQLSDVAFNIRELSKKLSHIKLKLKVQNIFILGKAYDEAVVVHTKELAEWLLKHDRHHRV
jgi:NAD+ kinase